MTPTDIDEIDRSILAALQEDASRSAAEIAKEVGLSQSPCWRRIQRLKDQGCILKIVALLDRGKLDLNAQLFVQVKVAKNDLASLAEFSQVIRLFPEVLECHVILGAYDFMLRVVVQDMEAYEKFHFGKLTCVPHVREVNYVRSLAEAKYTTSLPLAI
jgi:Lrp/AsnC family transcriptional regulator